MCAVSMWCELRMALVRFIATLHCSRRGYRVEADVCYLLADVIASLIAELFVALFVALVRAVVPLVIA